jgi:hypothetical protein
MVRSLERRVVALEEATSGDDGECARCGWGGGDDDNHTYELTFIDPGGPDDREEFCEASGRQLVYILTWGDEALNPCRSCEVASYRAWSQSVGGRIPSRMEGANE